MITYTTSHAGDFKGSPAASLVGNEEKCLNMGAPAADQHEAKQQQKKQQVFNQILITLFLKTHFTHSTTVK